VDHSIPIGERTRAARSRPPTPPDVAAEAPTPGDAGPPHLFGPSGATEADRCDVGERPSQNEARA